MMHFARMLGRLLLWIFTIVYERSRNSISKEHSLNFSRSNFRSEGENALADALYKNTSLTYLKFRSNEKWSRRS